MTEREWLDGIVGSMERVFSAPPSTNLDRYVIAGCDKIDARPRKPAWFRPIARWLYARSERETHLELDRLNAIETCHACAGTFESFDLPCAIHQTPDEVDLALAVVSLRRMRERIKEGRRP